MPVIPLAHSTGFGWDELVIFGTILVGILVYRAVRGSVDPGPEGEEDGPDRKAPPAREGKG